VYTLEPESVAVWLSVSQTVTSLSQVDKKLREALV